jgi:dolichol-phosphate mannosyltransferase
MKISVVIPAHNEEASLEPTVRALVTALQQEQIPYEILIVNDNSTDRTEEVCARLSRQFQGV